jgi:hypothetical protein
MWTVSYVNKVRVSWEVQEDGRIWITCTEPTFSEGDKRAFLSAMSEAAILRPEVTKAVFNSSTPLLVIYVS